MENPIQAENYFTQSVNRLEVQMNHLTNIVKDTDEETLPKIFSTIRDCPNILIRMRNYGVLKTLIKIQFQHKTLN